MPEHFQQLLAQLPFAPTDTPNLMILLSWLSMLLIGIAVYLIAKGLIMPIVRQLLVHFNPNLTASIIKPLTDLTTRLAWLAPVVFFLSTFKWFVEPHMVLSGLINTLFYLYFYFNLVLVMTSILNIGAVIYGQQAFAKDIPLDGVLQTVKLALIMIFVVLAISEVMGKTPLYLLSSLGALTAVLLLIFKDTIMGLVAGIQIATNRLVAIGDWIEVPQYGADGDVLEVGLHMVKIRNWDNTITTIPTYKLISDSFKNWRGMSQSDGRRIKRSIRIDVHSVNFIDKVQTEAILNKLANKKFAALAIGTCETNMGLFRQYVEFYLQQHDQVNQQMTLMARQLQPSEYGMAIELYCFCADKRWVYYEKTQAQILEHLFAQLPVFGLRAFQRPASLISESTV